MLDSNSDVGVEEYRNDVDKDLGDGNWANRKWPDQAGEGSSAEVTLDSGRASPST